MEKNFNHKNPFNIGDMVFIDQSKTAYNDCEKIREIKDFQFRPYQGYFAVLEGLNKYVHIGCLTSIN